jgi:hypothetical protein
MTRRQPLSESFKEAPPDPTLALDTTRPAPAPPDGPGLVAVYVTSAVRTSAGSDLGPKRVPPAEAARLVAAKLAVYGDRPPGMPEPEGTVREFGAARPFRPSAVSN